MVPILMAHKAQPMDPLEYHNDGFIGMHRACWGGDKRHTDTVEAFLVAGVPHDFPDKKGNVSSTTKAIRRCLCFSAFF